MLGFIFINISTLAKTWAEGDVLMTIPQEYAPKTKSIPMTTCVYDGITTQINITPSGEIKVWGLGNLGTKSVNLHASVTYII